MKPPPNLRAHRTPFSSDNGSMNREERRFAKQRGLVGPVSWPIPCLCSNGHRWWAPGTIGAGHGTYFDDANNQWCPVCHEPEEHSMRKGTAPEGWAPPDYITRPDRDGDVHWDVRLAPEFLVVKQP